MAYAITENSEKELVWDNNPSGGRTRAVIKNNELVNFTVEDGETPVVMTTDLVMLAHLQEIIGELLNELNPA